VGYYVGLLNNKVFNYFYCYFCQFCLALKIIFKKFGIILNNEVIMLESVIQIFDMVIKQIFKNFNNSQKLN
jgi:hypothetical protein